MIDRVENAPPEAPLGEAALHALIEHAPDAIFVADLDGRFVYVNEAGCRMLGYSRSELLGRSLYDAVLPGDAERLARARTVMLEGQTRGAEWTLRRRDGSLLAVEVNANMTPGGQWQGFVRDISDRKALQAERERLFAQVEADRRQLQTLVETLPLGVVLFEPDGTIVANRRCEELLGMRLEPTGGTAQYADLIFFPDGKPVPPDELLGRRMLRGETVLAAEFLVRRSDGRELPVLASAAPIRGAAGEILGGVGVFQDMTERMRLERSVAENARLLKSVFDLLPVGIWIADRDGRIVSNNPAGERIWCGARHVALEQYGEYVGWFVGTGKRIEPEQWGMARAIQRGETTIGELVRIQCFDGSTKTIIHSAAPLRGENGEVAGAIVLNEDITALHDAQDRLRASEELFRAVFDLLPVGLWIADRDGRITRGNPAAHRIWQGAGQMGPEQYGRQQGWHVETGKPLSPDEWGIPRALRQGESSTRDLIRIQCFDGSFKTVINWAGPIRSDTGEITGAVAVNEDVSALHQTQEQLRAAVRDREEILALVTHDLRSPLSAIRTLAATLGLKAQRLPGGEPLRAMADNLMEVARQMSELVNDLLAVAVVRTNGSVLKLVPTKGSALLEKAVRSARPVFAREGMRLEVQVVGQLPVVQVDPDRILRVFANLLDNARKFTEPSGEVVLRAESLSAGVRYCVANSGAALPPKELEAMFQPFWQAGRSDARGAGLGLSICRAIVEAHGGSIWAEPAAGKRVRVCFLLPCAPATFPPAPPPA
ncbi:PAS domain S-box protein [Ramlibacter sp.]|uniref:PAS domain-containing sensor histidine kinase n=1 Tax=Ramlibacter sp. TaxID=1917967 RepID=UPI002C48B3BB|nr:PAS domain S-box protein [Ramlibacter sp.]HWI80741.1 PAS domain S-box protein [Ramlibacter sp.]